MTTKDVVKGRTKQGEAVTDEQLGRLSKRLFELYGRVKKGSVGFKSTMDGLQLLIAPLASSEASLDASASENWLTDIVAYNQKTLTVFFGKEFNLSEFEATLRKYGQKRIERWAKLGLQPVFLPKMPFSPEINYPGWRIKPEKWFWEKIAKGEIKRLINGQLQSVQEVRLDGIAVMVDTRYKPAYGNGRQMWEDDNFCGPILENLRQAGKISYYGDSPQSSRFGVSAKEWEEQIKPAMAKKLGLKLGQLRLELAIEANVIPQIFTDMPRQRDGQTNTSVWYEEYFDGLGGRLDGGCSGCGGLAHVVGLGVSACWYGRSFRLLAVL